MSKRINELKIRESRAAAAVFMDRVSHRPSNTSALIAAMQPPETEDGLSTAQSVDGGVPVTHYLMDDDNHEDTSTGLGESYTVTAAEPEALAGLRDEEWPMIGQSMQKGKGKEESVIQGLSAVKIAPSDSLQLKDPPVNAKALTKSEKPMPKIGQWSEPTMPDHRSNMIPSESGPQNTIRTDWDAFEFVRNFNGYYDCPFVECKYVPSRSYPLVLICHPSNLFQGVIP